LSAQRSAIYYFKYVAGYDNQPVLFGQFDRFTVFVSLGMAVRCSALTA